MGNLDIVARVERQDGEGGLSIVQNAEEERTEIFVEGKFRYDIHHHPTSFQSRREIVEFVSDFNKLIDIELVNEDGEIEIEFNDDLI
ncbi:hypothetical protein C5C07_13970 [Haloferax sp. Atlit-4N]|uniref:hypothetical protein n=1 Tax=Haloferax sp. Atlit-4N TaxID=2077206 RepID=UPI000E27AF47|nr:hypothetical protein [Haloferax sp. Atlit-4N]RDZ52859.1 hypothetical protein C5C07_13970 [Haloferax sp. Atlit-4N]